MAHSRLHSELLAISESKFFHKINIAVATIFTLTAIAYVAFEIIR